MGTCDICLVIRAILTKLSIHIHYAEGKNSKGCQGQGSRSSALCISKPCECNVSLVSGGISKKTCLQAFVMLTERIEIVVVVTVQGRQCSV